MSELTLRVLRPQDWLVYRTVRLAALEESAGVLGDTYDEEAAADEAYWRSQFDGARRFVAEFDGRPCGVVSVGRFETEPESVELFGLWVDPSVRSTGVAGRLVDTAATLAAGAGAKQIYYWVGTENGRAIGFATGFGFRVTSHRRPTLTGDPTLGDTEIALVLPLEDDPHTIPNPTGLVAATVTQSTDADHRAVSQVDPARRKVAPRTGLGVQLFVPVAVALAVTGLAQLDGTGLLARCFQHETDHLDGMVFGDRLSSRRRRLYESHHQAADLYPFDWPASTIERV